jgi:hypothetical protein
MGRRWVFLPVAVQADVIALQGDNVGLQGVAALPG